jgi:hypothetical protein
MFLATSKIPLDVGAPISYVNKVIQLFAYGHGMVDKNRKDLLSMVSVGAIFLMSVQPNPLIS